MNKDQVTGVSERVIYGVVMYFVAMGISQGWYNADMAAYIASGLTTVIGGAWAWWINRPQALLRAAAQTNPETKMVTTAEKAEAPETNIVSNTDVKVIPK